MSKTFKPKKQLGGNGNNGVIVEKGELYRDENGNLKQISNRAPSHDSKAGGLLIPDAQMVLSDSYSQVQAGSRSNSLEEKLVKFDKKQIESLAEQLPFDIKVKRSLSPAKTFQLFKEALNKKQKQFDDKTNGTPKDNIQENTLRLNLQNANSLPTEDDLFDIVFTQQEANKAANPELFRQNTTSQYGGTYNAHDAANEGTQFVRDWIRQRSFTGLSGLRPSNWMQGLEISDPRVLSPAQMEHKFEDVTGLPFGSGKGYDGFYDEIGDKSYVQFNQNYPSYSKTVATHESTHQLQKKLGEGKTNSPIEQSYNIIQNELKRNNKNVSGRVGNGLQSANDYYGDPSEIHARIMQVREALQLSPFETVTPQHLSESFDREWESGDQYDKFRNSMLELRQNLDEQGILTILNQTVSNNNGNGNTYAQYGGKKLSFEKWRATLPPNLRDTDTTQYNLRGAYEAGLQPELVGDGSYHLGSRNPQTGELLKYKNHPTYNLMVEGEKQAGYEIYEKDGKQYSRPMKKFVPKKKMQMGGVDDVSMQGYRFDSPYQNAEQLLIQGGNIDMSATPQDLALIPIKNGIPDVLSSQIANAWDNQPYNFNADQVLEVPVVAQYGLRNRKSNTQYIDPRFPNGYGQYIPNVDPRAPFSPYRDPQNFGADATAVIDGVKVPMRYNSLDGTYLDGQGREWDYDSNARKFKRRVGTEGGNKTNTNSSQPVETAEVVTTPTNTTKRKFVKGGKKAQQTAVENKPTVAVDNLTWDGLVQPNMNNIPGANGKLLPLEQQNVIDKNAQTQGLLNTPEYRANKNTMESKFTAKSNGEDVSGSRKRRFDFSNPELDFVTGMAIADSYNTIAPMRQQVDFKTALQSYVDPRPYLSEIRSQRNATLQNINPNSSVGQAFISQIDANTQRQTAQVMNQINTQNQQIEYQNQQNLANTFNQEAIANLQFDKQYFNEVLGTQEASRQQRMNAFQNWATNKQRERAFRNNVMLNALYAPNFYDDDLELIGNRNNKKVVFKRS